MSKRREMRVIAPIETDAELSLEEPGQQSTEANVKNDSTLAKHGYAILAQFNRFVKRKPTDRPLFVGEYFEDEPPPEAGDGDIVDDVLSGYVISKNGHVSGTMAEMRPRAHRTLVNAFASREQAQAAAEEMLAREISESTRPQPPKVRIASIEVPIAEVAKRFSGKVAVNLDVDEIQIVDGILEAARHNNTWLPDQQPVDSRADVIRWLVSLLRSRL
jgi:hypothetical protein